MNCRHISKFMCNKANFKSISTQPSAKFQQIINRVQHYPKENLRSLKFVSKVKYPKISAATYHDSAQQAKISKRILFLQNAGASGAVDADVLLNRVNLTKISPPSLMNFSTKSMVKSRVGKSISKHSAGSRITSASSSRSSFINKSNSFLQKFMSLNAQKRYESTDSWTVMSPSRHDRGERGTKMRTEKKAEISPHMDEMAQMEQMSAFTSGNQVSYNHSQDKIEDQPKNKGEDKVENIPSSSKYEADYATEPLTLAFNIRGKLDDMSSRIRDDLMKIDVSLKERLSSIKTKVSRGKAQTDQKDKSNQSHQNPTIQTSTTNIDLINIMEGTCLNSPYNACVKKRSIIGRSTKLSRRVGIRPDMINVDQPAEDLTRHHRLIEPFQVKDYLMDIPSIQQRSEHPPEPMRTYYPDKHLIEVTTKDAVDADGIYCASRRKRLSSS